MKTGAVSQANGLLARRRVVRLLAATSVVGLAGAIGVASGRTPSPEVSLHRWRGAALGADASLLINDPDEGRADRLISLVLAEIDRLEKMVASQFENLA